MFTGTLWPNCKTYRAGQICRSTPISVYGLQNSRISLLEPSSLIRKTY